MQRLIFVGLAGMLLVAGTLLCVLSGLLAVRVSTASPAVLLPLTLNATPARVAAAALSATATATPTRRPTRTPAPTATRTTTSTPTVPRLPTATLAPNLPTATPCNTPTRTPIPSPTSTPLPSGDSEFFSSEFQSAAMNAKMAFQIYLPPGYRDSDRRYPVLYLLHGWGGDFGEFGWYNTQSTADELMRDGEIPPMIIVTPEGDKSYWFNHFQGPPWGDYVANDLVQYIDGNYRTIPKRESRAIGGLSMGALGAMQLTLNHPDLFTIVGLRSPTFRRIGDPDVPAFFGDAEYYKFYDPFDLVERTGARLPAYTYVIIGQDDIWLGRIHDFLHLLDQHKSPYELHVYPGEHDAAFFGSRLDEDLRFYGAHISIEP